MDVVIFGQELRAMAATHRRYKLPYNPTSLMRQFGSTWLGNLRLAFPGGDSFDPASVRG